MLVPDPLFFTRKSNIISKKEFVDLKKIMLESFENIAALAKMRIEP